MRRPLVAVAVAVVILAAATAGGFLIAACGGSSGSASTTQTAAAGPAGQAPDMSSLFAQALDPLVEDGTITSDQESAVIDALGSSRSRRPGAGGSPQAVSPAPARRRPPGRCRATARRRPPAGSRARCPTRARCSARRWTAW